MLLSTLPSHACLWDSDTLAAEAKGLPDTIQIITGRFERNPPRYYQMRLERVTTEIARDPSSLALYDDAGVACDRLGRGDEAIGWMEKKRAQLEAADQADSSVKNHWYRYHANVGTFWVHRWFYNGRDRNRITEVVTGRDFIKHAIELNPDAHFGREKYQLLAMEWIISPPAYDPTKERLPDFLNLSEESLYATEDRGQLARLGYSAARNSC